MMSQRLLATIVLLCTFSTTASAQTETAKPAKEKRAMAQWANFEYDRQLMLETEKDRERLLYDFCQRGMLESTGMACNIFAVYWPDGLDSWIEKRLLPMERFKKALAEAKYTMDYFDPNRVDLADKALQKRIEDSPIWATYQGGGVESKTSKRIFSDGDRTKLPGLYLRAEGLMALCRPEFAKLFEPRERQWEVKRMVADRDSTFMDFNRALYLDIKEKPTVAVMMRKLQVDLDCQIVLFLNDVERDRLVEIIERSRSFDQFSGVETPVETDFRNQSK